LAKEESTGQSDAFKPTRCEKEYAVAFSVTLGEVRSSLLLERMKNLNNDLADRV
jgi:hypothetical protein